MNYTNSKNWTIKDEIRDYWSGRAATFDLQPGHEIFTSEERRAWLALFRKHLGDGAGRSALDLASGTGVISLLLNDLGFAVTGLDFSETMMDRATGKARAKNAAIRFRLGDAEQTMEPDGVYDVVTNRHLVWTLPDPAGAFADWLRVLKPGGRVLIVDGDFVTRGTRAKLFSLAAKLVRAVAPGNEQLPPVDRERHRRILEQVHFARGARAEDVADLLRRAGFTDVVIDRDLRDIRRGQGMVMPLHRRIERAAQDRYAISARKPPSGAVPQERTPGRRELA